MTKQKLQGTRNQPLKNAAFVEELDRVCAFRGTKTPRREAAKCDECGAESVY